MRWSFEHLGSCSAILKNGEIRLFISAIFQDRNLARLKSRRYKYHFSKFHRDWTDRSWDMMENVFDLATQPKNFFSRHCKNVFVGQMFTVNNNNQLHLSKIVYLVEDYNRSTAVNLDLGSLHAKPVFSTLKSVL